MTLSDYDFTLPKELIAQDPIENRSDSRLFVIDRKSGSFAHDRFYNIGNYLNPDDVLVINNTKVIPARLFGKRTTGAAIEVLLLKRITEDSWEVLTKPGKRAGIGTEIVFGDNLIRAKVIDIKNDGIRILQFFYSGIFEEILDVLGQMPLPPYITHELVDKSRYQTVYAKYDGSAAAPTAGLHFTPEVLEEIRIGGVSIAEITLHVGLGTFRPVKHENILEHEMHKEFYEVTNEACDIINTAKQNGGRIVAVGTTCVRTLETAAKSGEIVPCSGETDIFIYPGFKFNAVDSIITNFHLPKSTLLMLISAFTKRELILSAYQEAIREKYRFFSFGDAMLII